ncbi:hypothetical protein S1OALGB6SA_2427 [Olavius algarvensis spirochete endosymbiont]|uniref:hypothetical protein n=1 Tax=Olavius algarvensis spirochete endosymbiont TaxID=260710 RepID=UPI000F0F578E|nr:hypothetical protein [Olavius algarvensis spirochete endosymbiont]CAD7841614.1 MAG: hypothetical protein [Olavius algarvensis spirochete endosymbiont]VDB01323.1 hypothetical protein S1OALGB6SA_2427 [Olavius algarvensis spirochete endosymbiont]
MKTNKGLLYLLAFALFFSVGCEKRNNEKQISGSEESIEESVKEIVVEEVPRKPEEPLSVEDYITWNYPEFSIFKAIPSNVLPDIEEEYMVFLKHPNRYAREIPPIYSIARFLCVYVDDGKTQEYLIPTESIGYAEEVLEVILSYEADYGPWLDYCYLPDVDGDGVQELVTFSLTGIFFRMDVWKFQDGEFQSITEEQLYITPQSN